MIKYHLKYKALYLTCVKLYALLSCLIIYSCGTTQKKKSSYDEREERIDTTRALIQTDLFKQGLHGKVKKTITYKYKNPYGGSDRVLLQTLTCTYNQHGFLTQTIAHDKGNSLPDIVTYFYDSLQLIATTTIDHMGDTTKRTYTYDKKNGHLIKSRTNNDGYYGLKFEYNEQGLISEESSNSTMVKHEYSYNSKGLLSRHAIYERIFNLYRTETHTYDSTGQLAITAIYKEYYIEPVAETVYTITDTDKQNNWTKRNITTTSVDQPTIYEYHEREIEYYDKPFQK